MKMDKDYDKKYSITKGYGKYIFRDNEKKKIMPFKFEGIMIRYITRLKIPLSEIHLSRSLSDEEQSGISEKLK